MTKPNLATMGFLAVAFAMVGLIGLIASYAAPLPLERAMARDAALDAVLEQAGSDPAAAIEALRPRLAESADALLAAGGDLAGRRSRASGPLCMRGCWPNLAIPGRGCAG